MNPNLDGKIYIPDEFENVLLERLPLSKEVLSFLKRNRILSLKEIQNSRDITEQIINSSKKPFPELKRFITQIQKSPSGQIILEKPIESQPITLTEEDDTSDVIEIPQNLKQLPVNYLIPSNKLAMNLKKLDVYFLKDLHGLNYRTILQSPNFGKKTISELQNLIKFVVKFNSTSDFETILFASIKRKKAEELALKTQELENSEKDLKPLKKVIQRRKTNKTKVIRRKTDKSLSSQSSTNRPTSNLDVFGVMNFINEFIESLENIDKEILLYRFAGSNYERVFKFEEIAAALHTSKEQSYQIHRKTLQNLKSELKRAADGVLEELKENCLSAMCPLTPRFLVSLVNNEFELFQYPPGFYIRLFSEIKPKMPILPAFERQEIVLDKNENQIVQKIKGILENYGAALSLANIYNQVAPTFYADNDFIDTFFKVIYAQQFVIISGDKPDEIFLDLSDNKR